MSGFGSNDEKCLTKGSIASPGVGVEFLPPKVLSPRDPGGNSIPGGLAATRGDSGGAGSGKGATDGGGKIYDIPSFTLRMYRDIRKTAK